MTAPTPTPDAVQIVAKALTVALATSDTPYEDVVAALAAAGLLVDRERLAALEAVAEAAREHVGTCQLMPTPDLLHLLAALDAVPAAGHQTEGDRHGFRRRQGSQGCARRGGAGRQVRGSRQGGAASQQGGAAFRQGGSASRRAEGPPLIGR